MDTSLILHTVLGLLLLLIPAGALYLLEAKVPNKQGGSDVLRKFGVAVARMIVQLLVLCLIVWALIRVDSPWLLVVCVVALAGVSAWLVSKRCKLTSGMQMTAVGIGLLVGVLLVGLWLLGLVFPVKIFDARWFVPVMALLMGHSTSMMIRGLNAFLSALKTDEQQYEFLRGNGLSHFKALMPFLRRSLLAVISPTTTNISVLGLASMPLLLGGIFLGGMSPINAFLVMLQMTVGCISASVLSLVVAIWLADRQLFDKFGKLK